jgi:hypothetical protein
VHYPAPSNSATSPSEAGQQGDRGWPASRTIGVVDDFRAVPADLRRIRLADLRHVSLDVGGKPLTTAEQPAPADLTGCESGMVVERMDIDRQFIAVLRAEGVVEKEPGADVEIALSRFRRVGAALGILMVACDVGEAGAVAMLRTASQRTNRSLRELADQIVATGDVSVVTLPPRAGYKLVKAAPPTSGATHRRPSVGTAQRAVAHRQPSHPRSELHW